MAKVAPNIKPTAFVVPSIIIDPATPKTTPKSSLTTTPKVAIEPVKETNDVVDGPEIKNPDLVLVQAESRRFSKLPHANPESPDAVKLGHFAVIPTPDSKSGPPKTLASTLKAHDEKSRRFSQLPPASVDSPNAVKVGKFGVVPTPDKPDSTEKSDINGAKKDGISEIAEKSGVVEKSVEQTNPGIIEISEDEINIAEAQHSKLSENPKLSETSIKIIKPDTPKLSENSHSSQTSKLSKNPKLSENPTKPEISLTPTNLLIANVQGEKSRRFSKLPPASVNSPNAVKLGSKFTMISRENDEK